MVTIVTLPVSPGPRKAVARLVSYSSDLTGPLGGPTQRVLRLGSRFAVDYEFPPMTPANAQVTVNRLVYAEASPVAVRFPMRGYVAPSVGAVVVAGSGAVGGSLPIRGGIPNATIAEGRPLHLASGGRRYIHIVQASLTLDGSGAGTLPITPLLRVQPADGDALELVAPVIEGFVEKSGITWSVELASVEGIKFTVTEDR